jgi:glycerol-3-phosphate O-acyltransferase / dihydroxyacetone phosphate acyltransferase
VRGVILRLLLDRLLAALAKVVLLGFFRSVEVEGRDHLPDAGVPLLVVANHFNGLVDPVAVVRALGRMPRFLAKATLWDIRPARPLLAAAGLIPVHRAIDAVDTSQNASTFRAAQETLAQGEVVAMFPEGITHDATRLAELRTGAARIALGARASGVKQIRILPVGLLFESKLALRSRLLIRIGPLIDLDREITGLLAGAMGAEAGEGNREAVRRLTAMIRERLGAVSPDYESRWEKSALGFAADIALRDVGGHQAEVPLAARERLAMRLARKPEVVRARLRALVADYALDLQAAGLRDPELVATYSRRRLLARLVVTGAVVALVTPFAAVGMAVNVVPYLAVSWVGRSVVNPVSKGTARFLTALVLFPLVWVLAAARVVDDWWRVLLLAAWYAIAGLLVVRVLEAVLRLVGDYHSWQSVRERRSLLPELLARRADVVAEIIEAAEAGTPRLDDVGEQAG